MGIDPSGMTRHIIDGKPVSEFAGLAIARFPGEDKTYLFYCDRDWNVVTDTLWRNASEGVDRARAEYPGIVLRSGDDLQGDPPAPDTDDDPMIEEARANLKAVDTIEAIAQNLAGRGSSHMEIIDVLRSVGVSLFDAHQAARRASQ